MLAVAALESEALAKELLREWMAAGKLPWSCMLWKGPVAEVIAFVEQINRMGKTFYPIPSTAYHGGDPQAQFWRAFLTIDWKTTRRTRTRLAAHKPGGSRRRAGTSSRCCPRPPQDAPAAASKPVPSPDQRRKAGAKPKYDWDAIQAHCHQWFDDNGYPENLSKFCRDEIIPWCEQRYGADGTPDMETLRAHVTRWIAAWQRSLLPK